MFVYQRPVRFEDVDVAQIVFFSRFLNYCHEAMEAFFGALEGGYVDLVLRRKIGLPAVHVDIDFKKPLRYGDVARIEIDVPHVGVRSLTLRYTFRHAPDGDPIAIIRHVCASTDLTQLVAVPVPDDVRRVLDAHRA